MQLDGAELPTNVKLPHVVEVFALLLDQSDVNRCFLSIPVRSALSCLAKAQS